MILILENIDVKRNSINCLKLGKLDDFRNIYTNGREKKSLVKKRIKIPRITKENKSKDEGGRRKVA